MSALVAYPLLVIVGLLILILATTSKISGMKFMLMGISIILVGGVLIIDENTRLAGFEYFMLFTGLIFGVIGFIREN
ncbi:hypothetical protein JOC95_001500 [Bacillus tianshenii]|uniref:Uncharacterized protein n=1 Tax=Sutcliffiella tianshenii TaxID=1463404 RepID=A0ABS2NZ44_9BACI|nr:hypothetical protein [Bacillus tianshenii]MBM7619648.1 hypothetical protein [Bacillus tianshenii]